MDKLIGHAESRNRDFYANGKPVVSPAGAMYEMQVMPATARDPGFGVKPAQNNTPAEYNRVGKDYWRMLRGRYGGDMSRVFGAYNAGPGALDSLIGKYGDDWLRYAPAETRAYVTDNMRRLRALGGY